MLAANKAGFAEDPPHWRSYATATCDGLLALRATGARDDDPRIIAALRWLARHRDLDLLGGIPQEQPVAWAESIRFYHYAVRARVQRRWQPAEGADVPLRRLIAARQQSDGSFINVRGHLMKEDDPLVCTALAVLALAETE